MIGNTGPGFCKCDAPIPLKEESNSLESGTRTDTEARTGLYVVLFYWPNEFECIGRPWRSRAVRGREDTEPVRPLLTWFRLAACTSRYRHDTRLKTAHPPRGHVRACKGIPYVCKRVGKKVRTDMKKWSTCWTPHSCSAVAPTQNSMDTSHWQKQKSVSEYVFLTACLAGQWVALSVRV